MVEQGTKATDTQQLSQSREAVHERFSQDTLKENLGKLSRFGGFSFLESAIDRVQNLNPDRKARMSIYLKDEDKKEDRRNLLRTLDLWIEMLEENGTVDEMLSACNTEVNEYNPQIQKSGETKTKGSKSGKNRGKSQFQAVIEI